MAIFRAAIAAVEPQRLVAHHLHREASEIVVATPAGEVARWRPPTLVIGAGKAAARMAAACEDVLDSDSLGGEVIIAPGCSVPLRSVQITEAGHPLPDARGEAAARRIIARLHAARNGGILCLISGGASSLMVCPRSPVTLDHKIQTTRLLLECGASIDEFNCVRKHLSEVKGGGLLRHARLPVVTLALSDVIGDDPSTIGSGPTAADPTTFADAAAVLMRYGLTSRVPATVAQLIQQGCEGAVSETVKPGSLQARRSHSVVVGSNRTALAGAAQAARDRGWTVQVETAPLAGDTTEAAHAFAARLVTQAHTTGHPPLCVLAGGETTVQISGQGHGGRNQEFALAMAQCIAGEPILMLSAGTDGIDGPTDAAGAFVDGSSSARASVSRLDVDSGLAMNDSYTIVAALGDLVKCGATGTNVGDIKIALLPGVPGSTPSPMVQRPR